MFTPIFSVQHALAVWFSHKGLVIMLTLIQNRKQLKMNKTGTMCTAPKWKKGIKDITVMTGETVILMTWNPPSKGFMEGHSI